MPHNNNHTQGQSHRQQGGQNRQQQGGQNRTQQTQREGQEEYTLQGNLGLLFSRRYYDGVTETEIANENYFKQRNKNLIAQGRQCNYSSILNTLNTAFKDEPCQTFELTTVYPGLIAGIGLVHGAGLKSEAKLGLAFDHSTGLPYLPASSVKGVLRSMFPYCVDNKAKPKDEQRSRFICDALSMVLNETDLDELTLDIFGSEQDDRENHVMGRDIFFDAMPVRAKSGLFGLDFITPHTGGEFADPNPIQFMRVMPDVTYRFMFRLHDTVLRSGATVTVEQKKELFRAILTTIGIGAKTNVGYGQLRVPNNQ